MKYINFTEQKRDELRAAYDKAVAAKLDVFEFEGSELLTEYARHMLSYLDLVMSGEVRMGATGRKDHSHGTS